MNVAINGLGRDGRATLKMALDTTEFNLVAVNNVPVENIAYLLKHNTAYGRYVRRVTTEHRNLDKLMYWYDNAWGCSNQMVREAKEITEKVANVSA